MVLKRLLIENYRGLKNVHMPLSNFACIIGENNAGKSSVLQAISVFFSGSTLQRTDFFDPEASIRIELEFVDIDESDIERLEDQHRDKVRTLLEGGALTLVRAYGTDGKGKIKLVTMIPKETRFKEEYIGELTKGKTPGPEFMAVLSSEYPELADAFNIKTNQTQAKELIRKLIDNLPEIDKESGDTDLPTGLEKNILAMLPEPIYIQAVKDLADDTKTQERTPFGKVLGVLLKAIEVELNSETELFRSLKTKLNRIENEDGTFEDNRLEEVQVIEQTVERYVKESFSNISLDISIPPPEIKAVLSGAQIFVNDGVKGLVDSKGDGLRRAVVFAIMRAYVDLSKMERFVGNKLQKGSYLLLFEEPELYLHPKAQDILFKALSEFSKDHFVVVSTHSPRFFGPRSTATFIKMKKKQDKTIAKLPFAAALPVDLGDVNAKDQFQLICYENNNAAFFSDTVVLVEGDSDFILFPHIASTINPKWDTAITSISFARINGKGSIKRYRDFFTRFDVRVHVISDLDLIISGFEHLQPSVELQTLRGKLIQEIDKELETVEQPAPSGKTISKARESGENRANWRKATEIRDAFVNGKASWEDLNTSVQTFFAWESNKQKREILENPPTERIEELKMELLAQLRAVDVYVLSRGAIEAYYPEEIVGSDKPNKAQNFCNTICTKDGLLGCCDVVPVGDGSNDHEFHIICKSIFGDNGNGTETVATVALD